MKKELPFLHLKVQESDPFQRGKFIGERVSDKINGNVEIYKKIFKEYANADWDTVQTKALRFVEPIQEYAPEMIEELKGMAKGSDLDLADLIALNVRTEIMFGFSQGVSAECTACALSKNNTTNQHVIIGQNWDWKTDVQKNTIITEIEQPPYPSIMMIAEAGHLGKIGFNSAGIGLCANLLVSSLDKGEVGVPFHAILRKILNSRTFNEAVRAVTLANRASSGNYLIANDKGTILNLETGPGGKENVYYLGSDEGIFGHANNFLVETDFEDKTLGILPDSPARAKNIKHELSKFAEVSVEHIQDTLRNHDNFPNSICRHSEPINQIQTLASIIMDLTEKSMTIAPGPPCENSFTKVYPDFYKKINAV
ncbi:C45 family autoproteolytic acyltransferase/hydolase [Brevibacillus massiliensis]|uniref:C45 family autoproteolytic acyltransferase/hydolase n=1 Tax=Brevibacillus massiliensis TaxID=1118054 RepID=UPI0002E39EF0|nr:C45 family peptidase [Brevibacillus massiliensis]